METHGLDNDQLLQTFPTNPNTFSAPTTSTKTENQSGHLLKPDKHPEMVYY